MKIAIVGAGLLGRLIAWRLLSLQENKLVDQSLNISLFDSDFSGANSAAKVAAAMLAPLSELVSSEACVAEKGLASIELWRQWDVELKAKDIDMAFQQTGSLVVTHGNDEGDFQLFLNSLYNDIQTTSISEHDIEQLNRRSLDDLEPSLAKVFQKALFLKPEGSVDNVALLNGLMTLLESSAIHLNEEQLPETLTKSFLAAYDQVVDCRGFSAKQQWLDAKAQGVSDKVLRGVRGEVIRVRADDVSLSRPVRLMHPRYQLYVAPKPHNEFVIGATQIESESEHTITARSSLELLSALYSIDTGFAESQVLNSHAKCRPAFMDNLPSINLNNNLLCVNGLYRHGYLLSPVVVEEVLHCLGFHAISHWPEIVEGTLNKHNAHVLNAGVAC